MISVTIVNAAFVDDGQTFAESLNSSIFSSSFQLYLDDFKKKLRGSGMRIIKHSAVTAQIWLEGPDDREKALMDVVRGSWWFLENRISFRFLEVHVTDSLKQEVRVYRAKGPKQRYSFAEYQARPAASTVDSEIASAPDIFRITSFLDEPNEPEVRLEFNDWDHLEETLALEDPPEPDGSQLGDAMEAEILSQKLLKNTEGTHPGGYFDNHEGDNVLFHFNTLEDANRVAAHFQPIFTNKRKLRAFFKKHDLGQED